MGVRAGVVLPGVDPFAGVDPRTIRHGYGKHHDCDPLVDVMDRPRALPDGDDCDGDADPDCADAATGWLRSLVRWQSDRATDELWYGEGGDHDDIGGRRPRPHDTRQPFNPRWWTRHPIGHVVEEMGNFGSLFCVACMEVVYGERVLSRLEACPARERPDCGSEEETCPT